MSPAAPPAFALDARLGLSAIGNLTAAPIEAGIHLRWGFAPALGYPMFGFGLYRRPALEQVQEGCITVSVAELAVLLRDGWVQLAGAVVEYRLARCPTKPGGELSTVGPRWCRRFTITLAQPVALRSVELDGGASLAIAALDGRPVAAAVGTGQVGFSDVTADSVVLYMSDGGPTAVCFRTAADLLAGEWSANLLPAPGEPDAGFGLPLTLDAYNLHHRFENPADPAAGDLAEAQARLGAAGQPLAGTDFAQLRASLSAMVDEAIPGLMFDREVFRTSPDAAPLAERPLDLSLLFSLDPMAARILGLAFVDQPPFQDATYDYLLIGRWAAWQLPEPARVYSFAGVREGTQVPRRFALCGAEVTLPAAARVALFPRRPDGGCRKALQIRTDSQFWSSTEPATVRLPHGVDWVVFELGQRLDDLHLRAQALGVQLGELVVPAGDDPVHVVLDAGGASFIDVVAHGEFDLYGFRAAPSAASPPAPDALRAQPVGLAAAAFGQRYGDSPSLDPPSGVAVRGVPMPTAEQPEPTLLEAAPPIRAEPQGLGVRWDPPPATAVPVWPADTRRVPTLAAAYDVRLQFLGAGQSPGAIDPGAWQAIGRPSVLSPPAVQGQDAPPEPLMPGDDLCERFGPSPARSEEYPPGADLLSLPWAPEGWYVASVRARDPFGRVSAWADGSPALAAAVPAPPPPLAVTAKLLEAADPGLSPAELALVATHGDGCTRVTWEWPAHLRRQAPHAATFRVYAKRRRFNSLRAEVGAITAGPPGLLLCEVRAERLVEQHALVGSDLVSGGVAFAILANTRGSTPTLTVQVHTADPNLRPVPGPATLSLAAHVLARVASVTHGPGAEELTCEVASRLTLVADTLIGGHLSDARGAEFKILTHTAGATSSFRLESLAALGGPQPERGRAVVHPPRYGRVYEDTFDVTSWEGRVARIAVTAATGYEAIVPPIGLAATPAEPVRHGVIGVATADASTHGTDRFTQPPGPPWDATLAGLDGREGGASAPAAIVAVYRATPPAPAAPATDRRYTTPPDYFGRSFYTLRWPNVAAAQRGHVTWQALRASDRALFGLYHPDPARSDIDVAGMTAQDRTQLQAAHAAGQVGLVGDEVLRRLADRPGADRALVAANTDPIRGDGDQLQFVDAVDGKNPVRYLWRLRTRDGAGNLSPLGPASQPAWVPNTFPPTGVRVVACSGGERRATLRWVPNPEPDLAGYLVFSTEQGLPGEGLETLRLVRRPVDDEHDVPGRIEAYDRDGNQVIPTATITRAQADGLLSGNEIVLARAGLPGRQVFQYRLAAFDTAGNPSELTRIFTARTTGVDRPDPPAWDPPRAQPDGLHLSWTLPRPDLRSLVQRRTGDAQQPWTSVTGWLPAGVEATIDPAYQAGVPTRYRLRVMQPNGQINREFEELEV